MTISPDTKHNLASGFGLFPICAFFMFLSTAGSSYEGWVRVGMNTLTAGFCLLISYVFWWLMHDERSGHRWLNGYMLLHFASSFVVHVWVAWRWAVGSVAHIPMIVGVIQNTTLVMLALYVFIVRHEIRNTLRQSEEATQAAKRAAERQALQNLQAAVMVESLVTRSFEKPVPSSMEMRPNVGRG